MGRKPSSIDDYLATVSSDRRAALSKLRKTIRATLPDAQECISYSMPAFRDGGRTPIAAPVGAVPSAAQPAPQPSARKDWRAKSRDQVGKIPKKIVPMVARPMQIIRYGRGSSAGASLTGSCMNISMMTRR